MIAPLSPSQQALKRAGAAMVAAVGGVEALAGYCRIGKSQLSDACSINHPDRWLPIDVIADGEAITAGHPGAPHVTRELARRAGFELVALPVAGGAPIDWMRVIASVAKEAGDIIPLLAMHCHDGLTAAEIRSTGLINEFDEAIRILVEGRAAALAIRDE